MMSKARRIRSSPCFQYAPARVEVPVYRAFRAYKCRTGMNCCGWGWILQPRMPKEKELARARVRMLLQEGFMFCDRCGSTVPQNQRYCGTCGREFYAAFPVVYVQQSRVQRHVRMLAIFWIAYGAITALAGLACFLGAAIVQNIIRFGGPGGPPPFVHVILNVIGTVVLILSMFGFLAGWGLINREPWARMLT